MTLLGATATGLERSAALEFGGARGDWRCLGRTRQGHPRHPCRLGHDTPLEPW